MGLLTLGAVAAPAVAAPVVEPRPLVEEVEDLEDPSGFVLSADGSMLYVLTSFGDGSIVDVDSRTIVGTFPAIPGLELSGSHPRQALGPKIPLVIEGGYALLTLATGVHELFSLEALPGTQDAPTLSHVFLDSTGEVTAFTESGEFLRIDGDTITEMTPLYDREWWALPPHTSRDGALFFEHREHDESFRATMIVVDMRTGDVLLEFDQRDPSPFRPLAFDESGTSLWGTFLEDAQTLVNVDLATGNMTVSKTVETYYGDILLANAAEQWFTSGSDPAAGGSLAPGSESGGREFRCCTMSLLRLPDNGDLIYYDIEFNKVGFVTAPKIIDPVNVELSALGETAVFSAEAEGLALSADEEGADDSSPLGSIWQSSPDGVTWSDIPGETGSTLSVVATADSFPLEYRRHFFDPYWGPAPSSASARMTGVEPQITRPNDLPGGTAGEAYPGQIITATGQPGMTWSSTGLPATLTLNPATGEISGTTDTAGEFSFTVTVSDRFGTASRSYDLNVAAAAGVSPDPDPTEEPLPPSGQTLPSTGSPDWLPTAAIGAALILAGAAGVMARRRGARFRADVLG